MFDVVKLDSWNFTTETESDRFFVARIISITYLHLKKKTITDNGGFFLSFFLSAQ
jgi:hypothetical protein